MGGVMFASVFIIVGGDSLVEAMVKDFDLTANGVIIIFILGFILDWISVS